MNIILFLIACFVVVIIMAVLLQHKKFYDEIYKIYFDHTNTKAEELIDLLYDQLRVVMMKMPLEQHGGLFQALGVVRHNF